MNCQGLHKVTCLNEILQVTRVKVIFKETILVRLPFCSGTDHSQRQTQSFYNSAKYQVYKRCFFFFFFLSKLHLNTGLCTLRRSQHYFRPVDLNLWVKTSLVVKQRFHKSVLSDVIHIRYLYITVHNSSKISYKVTMK